MGIFSFIETFFFLSLAISFVLILLLVYHFKQRISLLEQKSDTMITIINDIAKEMSIIKCSCNCSNGGNAFSAMFGGSNGGVCMMPSSFDMFKTRDTDMEEMVELVPQQSDDEDEDDDDDDEEDDDDDDDDDYCDDEDEEKLPKIVVSDNESGVQANNTVDESAQEVCEIQPDTKKTEASGCGIRSGAEDIHAYSEGRRRSPEEYEETYRKMSLSALKQLVLSKELCADSSKMKKPELIQLLIGTYV